jgi:hypothetical protein
LLKWGGIGLGALAVEGVCGAWLRSAVGALDRFDAVQPAVDVQIFQTAASLENLLVTTYASALELPGIQEQASIAHAIELAMDHHAEHGAAFNAKIEALGGIKQDAPNPRYAQVVADAGPLTNVAAVVRLAAELEEVATDTYLSNVTMLGDPAARVLMASVMGVEAQHLATLRTVDALLASSLADLVSVPTTVELLPASIGSAAIPDAFEAPNLASPPAEGAVR